MGVVFWSVLCGRSSYIKINEKMISFRTNYPPVKPYFMRLSGILKSFIKVSKMVIFICYYVGVQKDRAKAQDAGSSQASPSQANSRSNVGHRYPFGER